MRRVALAVVAAIVPIVYLSTLSLLIAESLKHGCFSKDGCPGYKINDLVAFTVAAAHALLSAVVVAELALTKPKTAPSGQFLAEHDQGPPSEGSYLAGAYLLVWGLGGLGVFVFLASRQESSNNVPILMELSKSWWGTVAGAAYAYWGVEPPKPASQNE